MTNGPHESPIASGVNTNMSLLPMALMAAIGSMAIHMLVPAMPLITRDLGVGAATVQLAVTLYLIGLGGGQLIAGPFADRIGRRPVLLAGLLICLAGLVLSGVAPNALTLLLGRVVTALGAAAALVSVRAIVADIAIGTDATAHLAVLSSVVLLSPTLSPSVGGVVADIWGWRAIFGLLALWAAILIVIAYRGLDETHRPNKTTARSPVRDMLYLLGTVRFVRLAAAIALSSCGLYIFLSASSFLLIERWGLGPSEAGFCYLLVAGAGVAGTLIVRYLQAGRGAFRFGLAVTVVGSAAMVALAQIGFDGPITLTAPMMVVGLGTGIAAPAGLAAVMQAVPGLAATSTSLAGALQMIISGVVTTLVATIHVSSLSFLAFLILLCTFAALLAAPTGAAGQMVRFKP